MFASGTLPIVDDLSFRSQPSSDSTSTKQATVRKNIETLPRGGGGNNTNLAKLAHGMKFVVGADELEVLHRRHSHAPVKVEAVVPLCVGRFPRLKKEHVSVSTLLDA